MIASPADKPAASPAPAASDDSDPVAYLISEFEQVVLRMANEIDTLRARIRELEDAAAKANQSEEQT